MLPVMAKVGFTIFRQNLRHYFDEAADGDAIFVTRQGGKPTLVLVSEHAYLSHLSSRPSRFARSEKSRDLTEAAN
jgi:PHD/YefM family antitoxin component YafN of YafNO toxin-antitoxin module